MQISTTTEEFINELDRAHERIITGYLLMHGKETRKTYKAFMLKNSLLVEFLNANGSLGNYWDLQKKTRHVPQKKSFADIKNLDKLFGYARDEMNESLAEHALEPVKPEDFTNADFEYRIKFMRDALQTIFDEALTPAEKCKACDDYEQLYDTLKHQLGEKNLHNIIFHYFPHLTASSLKILRFHASQEPGIPASGKNKSNLLYFRPRAGL